MKNEPLFKFIAIAGIASVFLAFASAAKAGEKERETTRTGSYTTSKGGSGTISSTTTRANGVVKKQGSWTNAAGGTGSWQSQTTWDKSTKTATVDGSATRPNGSSTTWQGTKAVTAPGTISGSGTITRPNGATASYQSTDTRVAPGTWDKNTVITNANGTTVDRSVQTTVSGTSGTRVETTTLPDGKTVTRDSSFTQTESTVPAPAPSH